MSDIPPTATRCVLYARQSLGDQSVDQQLSLAAKRAEALGWRIVGRFADRSVSASTGVARPGYDQMLDLVKSGGADAIVVRHYDRLYRQPRELEDLIRDTEGVRIEATEAGLLDLSTASGRMTARVLGAVARQEAEMKGERQRLAAKRDADAGVPRLGCPRPFGFEEDRVTHREAEADAIRWAAEVLLTGATVSAVAREWGRRGLVTAQGGKSFATPDGKAAPYARQSVTSILRNPRLAALRTYKGEVVAPAAWEPILPEETWRAVCHLLDDPARKPPRGVRTLGGGVYLCQCGNTMVGTVDATAAHVYRCNPLTRSGRPGPHGQQRQVAVDAEVATRVVNALAAEAGDDLIVPRRADVAPLRTEKRAIEANLAGLARERVLGEISPAEHAAARAAAKARLDQIEAALADAASTSALQPFARLLDVPMEDLVAGVAARLEAAQAIWDGLGQERQRATVRAMFEVTVLPAGRGSRRFDPDKVVTVPAARAG